MRNEPNWDELAAKAETGALRPIEGSALTGDAAARAGRDFLLAATGTATLDEATHVALGRPTLGAQENVTWKVRATPELDGLAKQLAHQLGVNRSKLIRDALLEYAKNHAAA